MVAERQKVGKLNGIAIPLISDSKAVRLVLVTKCSYQPAEPDVRYLPNGDPGYPGCAADVEIEEVHFLHKRKDKRIKARLIEPDYKSHCWNQLHDGLM